MSPSAAALQPMSMRWAASSRCCSPWPARRRAAPSRTRELLANRRQPIITTLTLFAGTAEGLWESTDWGESWERVHGRPPASTST